MKIMCANRIAPDGMPRFAASHLGLFCLPMSHKKDARLIWVNKPRHEKNYICHSEDNQWADQLRRLISAT